MAVKALSCHLHSLTLVGLRSIFDNQTKTVGEIEHATFNALKAELRKAMGVVCPKHANPLGPDGEHARSQSTGRKGGG